MTAAPEPLCEVLDWDSRFFGFRIARARPDRVNSESLGQILAFCAAESVRCLYFQADPGDVTTIRTLEQAGFGFQDIRLTLVRKQLADVPSPDAGIRLATPKDVKELIAIAGQSHTDSRFYFDQNFPRERCTALYETWIEKSCAGYAAAVLVPVVEGRPAGYVTCSMPARELGQIGLIAVHEKARGSGIGKQIIRAALIWFREHGAAEVVTVTQGRNIGAIRMYERCGFIAQSARFWYHRWFDPARS